MLSGWNFSDALAEAMRVKKCPLICGLDPQLRYMPPHLVQEALERFGESMEAMGWLFETFMCQVIDAVADIVPAVKPQRAFYEAYSPAGEIAFCEVVRHAHDAGLVVIEDGKRGDGGDTADAYADGHLGEVPFFNGKTLKPPARVDCLTVHGYIAEDCVKRFIDRGVKKHGTGIFVVTKTSFKPNSAVEQLVTAGALQRKVWQELACMVQEWGEGTEGSCGLRNVGVVMGSTYPEDAPKMREILPNAWFLKPGYGGQGATAEDSVVGILDSGLGIVVNNSRNLTFCYRDLKKKAEGFPMLCESTKCFDLVRQKAIICRDELVAAARATGKWPF